MSSSNSSGLSIPSRPPSTMSDCLDPRPTWEDYQISDRFLDEKKSYAVDMSSIESLVTFTPSAHDNDGKYPGTAHPQYSLDVVSTLTRTSSPGRLYPRSIAPGCDPNGLLYYIDRNWRLVARQLCLQDIQGGRFGYGLEHVWMVEGVLKCHIIFDLNEGQSSHCSSWDPFNLTRSEAIFLGSLMVNPEWTCPVHSTGSRIREAETTKKRTVGWSYNVLSTPPSHLSSPPVHSSCLFRNITFQMCGNRNPRLSPNNQVAGRDAKRPPTKRVPLTGPMNLHQQLVMTRTFTYNSLTSFSIVQEPVLSRFAAAACPWAFGDAEDPNDIPGTNELPDADVPGTWAPSIIGLTSGFTPSTPV